MLYSLVNNLKESLYNIGTGEDISIKELAETIQQITGHLGQIIWDADKPDGTPRKLMDVTKMKKEGWQSHVDLKTGIEKTYKWFLDHQNDFRKVKI